MAEQTDRDGLYAGPAAGLAQPADVSAETPDAPAPAGPYHYVEPPYPLPRQRVGLFQAPRPEDLQAVEQWRAERDRRRALRDAARAWEQHLHAQAVAQQLPAARASLADAMVRALTRPTGLKPVTVKLLVDPATGWARTDKDELLPPATLTQILRTLPGRQPTLQARPLTPADLRRHDLGRQHRLVSPALRALLGQLDGERCRFPSCDRSSRLHAHHITFWAAAGRTDLANLALVCGRHHTLIHTQGFQLVLSNDRTLTVRTADDIPVPHHPALPQHPADDLDPSIAPSSTDWNNDRFDLGYVVHVMLQHSS